MKSIGGGDIDFATSGGGDGDLRSISGGDLRSISGGEKEGDQGGGDVA